jgi:hypothetical protein
VLEVKSITMAKLGLEVVAGGVEHRYRSREEGLALAPVGTQAV